MSAAEKAPVKQAPAQSLWFGTNPLHWQAWADKASFTAQGLGAVKMGRDEK